MVHQALRIELSPTAARRLHELSREAEGSGKAICHSYVRQEVRNKNDARTHKQEGWQVSLVDKNAVAEAPGWFAIDDLVVFVPSFHMLDSLQGKRLNYSDSGFSVTD